MAGQVYFGNKSKQMWIKAPASGMKAGSVGYVTEAQLLNGGASIDRSSGSHRKFSATWNGSIEDFHVVKDYADGIYGDGPFYWVDPFAADKNILPPHWASPALAEKGWTDLSAGSLVPTYASATSVNDYPVKHIEFTTSDNFVSTQKLTIIIPKDYALNFGWHGPSGASTAGIRIVPYKRVDGSADTALNPTRLDVSSTTRTNTKIKGDTYTHVEIFLATTTATTVKITGMIAQLLPENSSVENGGFISGRGTTGLEFASFPQMDYYSSNVNNGWVGMSLDWVEVE
jgi:hypothetical protein